MDEHRQKVVPSTKKYSFVEIDLTEPRQTAATKITEFNNLDDVTVPEDTGFELYVVYDQDGNEVNA